MNELEKAAALAVAVEILCGLTDDDKVRRLCCDPHYLESDDPHFLELSRPEESCACLCAARAVIAIATPKQRTESAQNAASARCV